MQLKHLEYFAEVAHCGSINQASRNLFVSPQALSAAIAALERELGFKLFYRQRLGVELTAEGRRVLEDTKKILPTIDSWFELAKNNVSELSGELGIYVSLALCASFNRFLIELAAKYPDLSIALHEGRGKNIVERMQKEPFGLSMCSLVPDIYEQYIPIIEKNQWQVIKLMEDEFYAVLGKDYFPELKGPLKAEDCAKMALICSSDSNDVIGRNYFKIFGGRLSSQVESHSSILYMVAQNKGVIILPQRIAKCEPMYQTGMIRILPIEGIHLKTSHYIIYSKRHDTSPATRALMEIIKEYYARADWEKS